MAPVGEVGTASMPTLERLLRKLPVLDLDRESRIPDLMLPFES
jgi:hypothetical protein